VSTAIQIVSHPSRQQILRAVWTEERSAGDIARAMPLTFGAVSQHLRLLRDAGVVSVRRDGRHRYYRANRDALGPLAAYLESVWARHLTTLKALAEFEDLDSRATKRPKRTRKR
jgi:DNA-binding transcriptional ArsR family regulator